MLCARLFLATCVALTCSGAELCGAEILKLCVRLGGCLTGEHGVGIEKRELMRVQFSAADLAQQMRVKSAFDPDWLLNPAKVFPLEGGAGSSDRSPAPRLAFGSPASLLGSPRTGEAASGFVDGDTIRCDRG
jgi:hypothetical protein